MADDGRRRLLVRGPHSSLTAPPPAVERHWHLALLGITHVDTPDEIVAPVHVCDMLEDGEVDDAGRDERVGFMACPCSRPASAQGPAPAPPAYMSPRLRLHSQGLPFSLISRQCRSLTLASRTPASQNFRMPSSTASPTSASASMIQIRSLEWKATAMKIGSGSGSPCKKDSVSLDESVGRSALRPVISESRGREDVSPLAEVR